jgi:hypothetical protein
MGCSTASPRTSALPNGVDPTRPSWPGRSRSASTPRGIATVHAQHVTHGRRPDRHGRARHPRCVMRSPAQRRGGVPSRQRALVGRQGPCTPGVGTQEVRTREGRSPPLGCRGEDSIACRGRRAKGHEAAEWRAPAPSKALFPGRERRLPGHAEPLLSVRRLCSGVRASRGFAADAFQRPLRSRFQPRLKPKRYLFSAAVRFPSQSPYSPSPSG